MRENCQMRREWRFAGFYLDALALINTIPAFVGTIMIAIGATARFHDNGAKWDMIITKPTQTSSQ